MSVTASGRVGRTEFEDHSIADLLGAEQLLGEGVATAVEAGGFRKLCVVVINSGDVVKGRKIDWHSASCDRRNGDGWL